MAIGIWPLGRAQRTSEMAMVAAEPVVQTKPGVDVPELVPAPPRRSWSWARRRAHGPGELIGGLLPSLLVDLKVVDDESSVDTDVARA